MKLVKEDKKDLLIFKIEILFLKMHDTHPESGNVLQPVHYVMATGEEEYFIEGEVLHFSKYVLRDYMVQVQ